LSSPEHLLDSAAILIGLLSNIDHFWNCKMVISACILGLCYTPWCLNLSYIMVSGYVLHLANYLAEHVESRRNSVKNVL
jgi:hypothetical protein